MRLAGKVAIVTGAGRGIGEAIARRFAAEGASVVVFDVRGDDAGRVAAALEEGGARSLAAVGSVAAAQDVQRLVEATCDRFGRIDILVNNAGISRAATVAKLTEEQWDEVLTVNLKGQFLCAKAVSVPMVEQRYGKIVNIASRSWLGSFGYANYSAAKAGVVGLTRTLALEVARFGINVNAIAPGLIETELNDTMSPERIQATIAAIPLGRRGRPDEVASLALFLASDEASYITGQTVLICGGRSIGAVMA